MQRNLCQCFNVIIKYYRNPSRVPYLSPFVFCYVSVRCSAAGCPISKSVTEKATVAMHGIVSALKGHIHSLWLIIFPVTHMSAQLAS